MEDGLKRLIEESRSVAKRKHLKVGSYCNQFTPHYPEQLMLYQSLFRGELSMRGVSGLVDIAKETFI